MRIDVTFLHLKSLNVYLPAALMHVFGILGIIFFITKYQFFC